MSQTPPQNNNEKTITFRVPRALIIALLFTALGAGAGALLGHYIGITLESFQATSASNNILAGQALQQFNLTQVAKVDYFVGEQTLSNAMAMPSLFTEAGTLIGAIAGFLFGVHYEEHKGTKNIKLE